MPVQEINDEILVLTKFLETNFKVCESILVYLNKVRIVNFTCTLLPYKGIIINKFLKDILFHGAQCVDVSVHLFGRRKTHQRLMSAFTLSSKATR